MGDLTQTVDILEEKIYKLININKRLSQLQQSTQEELIKLKAENEGLLAEIDQLESKNQSLKTANAMLGSNEYKKETKLQINSLIREIDQCIVQLSE